jgi:sterol desaturase/sphingolipid hydroxylase (fatty acid hydroxylase superfamily)
MDLLIAYAVPAFLALLGLEAWLDHTRPEGSGRGYSLRDTAASLSMGLGNVVIAALAKAPAALLFVVAYEHRIFDLGSGVVAWVLLIVCEDFTYYWYHRLHHEVRILWAAHVNHHSSTHFNLSTALRQSWTTPFTGPIFWVPLALIGFHPLMILTAQAISLIYQFWIHTERIDRLGPLEWILNTPSHHRVHHGRNVEYLDRNYAGIFMVWDRLFATFEPERAKVDYGLTKNLDTHNPWTIAFHDWVAMGRAVARSRSFREAWGAVFAPPGWSADGSTLTARQMQRGAIGSA